MGQQQIQNLRLLQMNTAELEHFIEEAAQENPLIDLPEYSGGTPRTPEEKQAAKWQWLEDSDYQNRAYFTPRSDGEEPDIFAAIGDSGGLEITLQRHLQDQLEQKALPEEERLLAKYLLESLDEDGYLRYSMEEIAADTGMGEGAVRHVLDTLKSLEPAGVCAYALSECLALQLRRRGSPAETIRIACGYLEELAHSHFHAISLALGISEKQVMEAREEIRSLNPRPGSQFAGRGCPVYVRPDIYVDRINNRFTVRPAEKKNTWFTVNEYYSRLMKSTEDRETHQYLSRKMAQLEEISRGIRQRGMTLEQLSQILVERQQRFFTEGASALTPLSMAEVADEMGLHISTVSRAVKNKYLQYPGGLLPLRCFFVRSTAPANGAGGAGVGTAAVKEALKALIRIESKKRPLSDQKLSERLMEAGYPVSRRTVAKYRGELGISSAAGRKEQ